MFYYTPNGQIIYSPTGGALIKSPISDVLTCPVLSGGVVSGDQTVSVGVDPSAFTSVSLASGGYGILTYTWQYSTTSIIPGSGSWIDIGSSNASTYDAPVQSETTHFCRKVTDQCYSLQTAYSNALTITISSGTAYSDNFNGYASYTYLKDTPNWDLEMGTGGGLAVYLNSVCPSVNADDQSDFYNHTFANDQYSQGTISSISAGSSYIGLSVRNIGLGTSNYYGWYGSNTDSYLFCYINGTPEYYATGGPWYDGETRKLEIVGTELRMYKNGALDTSISTDGKYTDTNNRHASGYAGLCGYNTHTLVRIDDWYGGDASGACPALLGGAILDDQTIDSGDTPAPFTSFTAASGGFGTLSYMWQYSSTGSDPWTDTGITTDTYAAGAQTETTYFRRKVTDQCASSPQISYSNSLTITVGTTPPPVTFSGPILSHDQYYVTYAGASNYDVVGKWNPWFPTEDYIGGTFSYSIINNVSNIYGINSVDGSLYIANNAGLTERTDEITIRTTLGSLSQDCSAFIRVMSTANCYFIDPGAGGGGTGTRALPYNAFHSFSVGKAYFLKRGTTYTSSIVPNVNGTEGSEIIFGAYGTGARPIINVGTSSFGIQIKASYLQFYEYEFTGNEFGIETEGTLGLFTNCLFSNLLFHNNTGTGGAQFYLKRNSFGEGSSLNAPEKNWTYHRVYDVIVYTNTTGHNMKYECGHVTTENVRSRDSQDGHGLSVPSWGQYNDFKGMSLLRNWQAGMELSGYGHTISDSYFEREWRGIMVADPCSWGSTIKRCVFTDGYGFGDDYGCQIVLDAYGTLWSDPTGPEVANGGNITIEDCIFDNDSYDPGIRIQHSIKNTTIRRNKFYNNVNAILLDGTGVSDVSIYDNIFYSNTPNDILGSAGTKINVFNNTCTGTITLTGTTSDIVKNNFYGSLTGATTSDHNIVMGDIATNNYFVDYTNHNYHLKSTAANARGMGTAVGVTTDYDSSTFANPPSIGAFEYFLDKL